MFSSYGYGSFGNIGSASTVLAVCAVIGLILGIVLLIVYLPAKNRGKYTGASKWFYDFLNFNQFWISSIIKVLFITISTACFLGGFICLFILPAVGLIAIIFGVLLRLLLELTMVLLSINQNVSQMNDTLTSMSGLQTAPAQPKVPAAQASPSSTTCPSCGTTNKPDSKFCTKCGTRIIQ